ncbi:MAG TPA: alpha/beta hydrolase [Rhizomicrobium sp.]|jgi:pimeloyl-ACP methyl ester carboxylesterase|nr:alpha/beta hydrolase [Rhizomicrobium sp.]
MQVPTSLRSGSGGNALVLLHGIGGCAKVWQSQLDFFAGRYAVVAWNMPGYGGSPPMPEMTFPALADALESLLDTLPNKRIHLVGHSMGGMVAQEFLRSRARRVTSVCLYATSPGLAQPETPEAVQAAEARAREFMERRIGPLDRGRTMRDMAESVLGQLLAPDAPNSARAAAIESISSVPPDVYRDAMRCILSFDGTAIVPKIDRPTLVIAGGEDRTMTPAVVDAMARQIPGAHYEVIPRVGHLANLEDPPAFNRVLSEFLASV